MACPRPNVARSNSKDIGQLTKILADRIWTATRMAPRGLLILVSGYRDPGSQWDLRHERCRGRECDRRCKGYPTTGLPAQWDGTKWVGGSHHQHRRAADMGGMDLDWLIRNRFAFGLALTVRGERWHFEAEGVDYLTGRPCPAPTVRIIPYPTGETRPEPPSEEPFTVAQYDEIIKRLERIEIEARAAASRAASAETEAKAAASRAKQAADGMTAVARMIGLTYAYARKGYSRVRAGHEVLHPDKKKALSAKAISIDALAVAQDTGRED